MARPTSRVCGVLMTGPLAPFEDAYREELRRCGYTARSAVCDVRQVARFSRWLEADGLSVTDVSEARAEQFMAWQRLDGRYRSRWSRPGLRCLVDVLRELGVLAAEELAVPSTPTDVLVDRFERYLVAERGLAAGTVALYSASVRRFAEGLPPERELPGLVVGGVTAAVLRESERVSVSATQSFVNGVRAFLRFCFVEGLVGSDLSRAALLVRGRSSSSLPRGISSADARALCAPVTGARRWGAGATRSSSRCCGWGYVAASWPACGLMTSTGGPVSCWSAARPLARTACR